MRCCARVMLQRLSDLPRIPLDRVGFENVLNLSPVPMICYFIMRTDTSR